MNVLLAGIGVLDFTTLLPGPYATQVLADLGADVIRIESPTRADMLRNWPPFNSDGNSAAYAQLNRSKRSIALDLKRCEAVDIVKELVKKHNVVIEQFRPGVMDRLGLGYNSLKSECSDLIYCSISGYGQTGPLKTRAGHDINFLALSGLASVSGHRETGPAPAGIQIADIAGGGQHAVIAILGAVIRRMISGYGQLIDISMTDCSLALTTMVGANYLASGRVPGSGTERLNGGSFYDYYQTADGRYIAIGSLEIKFCRAFFEAIDRPHWIRRAMDYESAVQLPLKSDLRRLIKTRTLNEWMKIFHQIDACVEPVLTFDEVRGHPMFQARKMFVQVSDRGGNRVTQVASPFKFSRATIKYSRTAPTLGQHTGEILEELGLSYSRIASLRAEKVIG